MDPESTVRVILDAIEAMDSGLIYEGVADLREWGRKGGFRPFGWTAGQTAAFCASCIVVADTLGSKGETARAARRRAVGFLPPV